MLDVWLQYNWQSEINMLCKRNIVVNFNFLFCVHSVIGSVIAPLMNNISNHELYDNTIKIAYTKLLNLQSTRVTDCFSNSGAIIH